MFRGLQMDQEKREKVAQLFREMTAGANKAHGGMGTHVLPDGWPGGGNTNIINSTIIVCGDGCHEAVAKLLGAQRRPR